MSKYSISQDKLELLMRLTAQINSKTDISSVLLAIMDAAKKIMDAEASSLFLVDEEKNDLVLTTPTGPATAELSNIRVSMTSSIAGWVVSHNESLIISDVSKDPRFGGDLQPDIFTTRNMICVPLRDSKGTVLGALQSINTDFVHHENHNLLFFEALANQAAIAITNARLQKEMVQRELMTQELNLAHSIQSGFWPKEVPALDSYSIAGTSIPANKVGGDYYDYVSIPGTSKLGFVVADVSGKGVPAALLMATVRSALRAHVENNLPPSEVIARVNTAIYRDTPSDKFITMFYGQLDSETHAFTYVNAGHNPPYLYDQHKQTLHPLTEGGLMLGVMPDIPYQCKSIVLQPGQQVVIFSDGITEAQNPEQEFLDEDGLEKWLIENPEQNAKHVVNNLITFVQDFQSTEPQFDDITLIVLSRKG